MIIGNLNGNLKVIELSTMIEIYNFTLFKKEISQIVTFGDNHFLVHDEGYDLYIF